MSAKVKDAAIAAAAQVKESSPLSFAKPTVEEQPAIKVEESLSDDEADMAARLAKIGGPTTTTGETATHSGTQATAVTSAPAVPTSAVISGTTNGTGTSAHANGTQRTLPSEADKTNGTTGLSAAPNSNGDSISMTLEVAEQYVRKAAKYLNSLPRNKNWPFTTDEVKEAAQKLHASMNGRKRSTMISDKYQDAFVALVVDYLNSLPRNPGNPINKALVKKIITENDGDYLNFCAKLASIGVIGTDAQDIFRLSRAINVATNEVESELSKAESASVGNGSPPKAGLTNPATLAKSMTDVTALVSKPTTPMTAAAASAAKKGAPTSMPLANAGAATTTPQPVFAPANMTTWPAQQQRENRVSAHSSLITSLLGTSLGSIIY
jgi:hypothetical protein